MSLLLTDTQDQALLALVIEEARQAADAQHWYVGRTALQKLMYFVQRSGVPSGYRFDLHHYGPYCADIARDVDWLIADGVVGDQSPSQERYSNYAPGTSLPELLAEHTTFVEQHRAEVSGIVAALVPLTPERLELLATLDFVHRWVRGQGTEPPWKQASLEKFIEVKADKFPHDTVEAVYDAMVEARIFTS